MLGSLTMGAIAAALTASPSLRHTVYESIGRSKTKTALRAFALLLALSSLKNLPFVWHVRLTARCLMLDRPIDERCRVVLTDRMLISAVSCSSEYSKRSCTSSTSSGTRGSRSTCSRR